MLEEPSSFHFIFIKRNVFIELNQKVLWFWKADEMCIIWMHFSRTFAVLLSPSIYPNELQLPSSTFNESLDLAVNCYTSSMSLKEPVDPKKVVWDGMLASPFPHIWIQIASYTILLKPSMVHVAASSLRSRTKRSS